MEQLNKIKQQIEKIKLCIEKIESEGYSEIEKDIILSEIRNVYSQIVDFKDKKNIKDISQAEELPTPEVKQEIVINELEEEPEKIINQENPQKEKKEPDLFQPKNNNGQGKKVIGEQLGKDKTSLNEKYAKVFSNVSGNISLSPLSDIKSGIGMGDKFLYVKELFNNNSSLFDETVNILNEAKSMDEALKFLDEKFEWNEDDPTVITFLNVVKRRYIRS